MFPLFITHDEYFVRCGGSGGGYYNVFDLSSYEVLSGWRQCVSSASAAAQWLQAAWRRCWQRGKGMGRAVAVLQRQRGNDSVAVVAVWRQRVGGHRGGNVGSAAALRQHDGNGRLGGCGGSLAASQCQLRQQSGGSCAAAARCHGGDKDTGGNSNGGGTTNNQQSTKSGSGNSNGNDDNNDT
jgi:hypothetical protein